MPHLPRESLDAALDTVRRRFPEARPRAGLILGSAWGGVIEAFHVRGEMNYDDIPGFGATSVAGHAGRLAWADCAGVETLVFQGRRHWYEGAGWLPVAIPVYVLKALGARRLVLTNAAGGIAEGLCAGDLMIVHDHINLFGTNPLIGPEDAFWGPRFPDQTKVYAPALIRGLTRAAAQAAVPARAGVYLGVSGPTYETPAEVRAFARLGADAVGMSTVPEAMLAKAAGLEVGALSCITNLASGISPTPLTHDEVTAAAREALPRMRAVLAEFWAAGLENP